MLGWGVAVCPPSLPTAPRSPKSPGAVGEAHPRLWSHAGG